MPQLDYGLLSAQQPRINTPFENLGQILQIRNQQEAAAGLREQRQGLAEKRRAEAEQTRQEAAAAAQVRSLFGRPNQPPTPEELASVIGPDKATEIFKGFEALKQATGANQDAARSRIASILGAIKAFPAPLRAGAYSGARAQLISDGTLKPEDAPETYEPTFIDNALRAALKPAEQIALDKPPADYTLGDQRISGATNQPIATAAPKAPEPAKLGTFEDFVGRYAATRRLKPEQLSAGDIAKAKAQYEAAGRSPAGAGSKFWVVRNGQQIRISDSEYRPGDLPASTREQGRPVTSGDAGRVSDLDTSLDDLGVLRKTIASSGSTGTSAKIGAMLPNVLTDVFGWGTEAKQKQAVIDRVKQVIGKALEEGVLRKEDEIKYEKILPTLADAAPVVETKLKGLEDAITLRRQRHLDALTDAGYETSKFNERGAKPKTPPVNDAAAKAAELIKKYGGG